MTKKREANPGFLAAARERRGRDKSQDELKEQQQKIEAIGQEILDALPDAGGPPVLAWRNKTAIQYSMKAVPSDADWNAALRWLLESNQIEKTGRETW